MKLMIIYSTIEGHTRNICKYLRNEAERMGHTAALFDASVMPPKPDEYDAVIIAGSIHRGKYQASIKHYAEKYHKVLNRKKSVLLSVSLSAAVEDTDLWNELIQHTEEFLLATGWEPTFVEQVAGALRYTEYDYLKRLIMRLISKRAGGDTDTSKDYEYTDWNQVKEIISKLDPSSQVETQSGSTAPGK